MRDGVFGKWPRGDSYRRRRNIPSTGRQWAVNGPSGASTPPGSAAAESDGLGDPLQCRGRPKTDRARCWNDQ
jgi:hypothetical protein